MDCYYTPLPPAHNRVVGDGGGVLESPVWVHLCVREGVVQRMSSEPVSPSITKHDVVVHDYEMECYAKILGCYYI